MFTLASGAPLPYPIRQSTLERALGRGLQYRGLYVLEEVYPLLEDAIEPDGRCSDVYLGYIRSSDTFVIGYEGELGNMWSGSIASMCAIEESGAVTVLDTFTLRDRGFFTRGGMHVKLHEEHGPDLIDIRLE